MAGHWINSSNVIGMAIWTSDVEICSNGVPHWVNKSIPDRATEYE